MGGTHQDNHMEVKGQCDVWSQCSLPPLYGFQNLPPVIRLLQQEALPTEPPYCPLIFTENFHKYDLI